MWCIASTNVICILALFRVRVEKWIEEVHTGCLVGGNLTKRDNLEHLGIDGRIILKLVFKNCNGEAWARWTWLMSCCCECGIKLQAFLKFGEFLHSLRTS
jgi:hypothetical protein